MYSVLPFDETNKLQSMPFEKYFGEMELTDQQEEERIKLARDIEAAMLYFFDAVVLYLNNGVGSLAALLSLLIAELTEAFDENELSEKEKQEDDDLPLLLLALMMPDDFVDGYVVTLARELYMSTMSHKDDPYFLSADRARLIGEEEANTVYNHLDYVKALAQGKKRKRWRTQRDAKVRTTHRPVDGQTIPIGDFFTVGAAKMLYPRDVVNGGNHPEEIVNCRCHVEYF